MIKSHTDVWKELLQKVFFNKEDGNSVFIAIKRTALILILLCGFGAPLEAGSIYEWIDKDGVKHFTNEPPPPGAKRDVPENQPKRRKSDWRSTGPLHERRRMAPRYPGIPDSRHRSLLF